MFPFHGVDYMEIDSLFSDEEKMVRQMVREFVDNEVNPHIEEWNREGKFPMHLVPQMAELGFCGANMQGYGCAGMSNVDYGLIMQELERGDSGLRASRLRRALVMYPIKEYGSEEQKDKWLPRSRARRSDVGLTEPDFGSTLLALHARRQRWRPLILNGEGLDRSNQRHVVVWYTDEGVADSWWRKGRPANGERLQGQWSLRASVTSSPSLQDARARANMFPKAQGMKAPLGCLTQARYGIAWGVLGAAMACYHSALEYSKVRIMFSKPIGSFQLVQAKLADMVTEITKGQLLALQVGRLKDKGRADFFRLHAQTQ
jgi:glutaryl-CoA dehydrogenase